MTGYAALGNSVNMDIAAEGNTVLAQPTRARLFSLLSELRRAAATDELAQRLRLHPNGVRKHLERLRDAGLVISERERRSRGRPRNLWSINPEAKPGGHRPTAYSELSQWLTRIIEGGRLDPEAIEAGGHQIGLQLTQNGGNGMDPEIRFHDALAAMGFQPSREPGPDGTLTYCLNNCPYRDAVQERQPLICGLHRGITSGLIAAIDPETEMTGFEVKDPENAGCLITVDGPLAAAAR